MAKRPVGRPPGRQTEPKDCSIFITERVRNRINVWKSMHSFPSQSAAIEDLLNQAGAPHPGNGNGAVHETEHAT